MDLRQLRYFTAIVEEGSFSRAAVRLGIAQPALSLHVRRMEEDLGIALLIRQASGVTPTEAGQLLVTRARAVLSDVQSLQDELRDVGGQPSGTVRIGLPGTISVILSVPLITRVRRNFPRIKIIVAEAMSGFVRDWLRDGRIDLAVLYGDPGEAGLKSVPLLEEELVLLLPPGTGAGEVGLERLSDAPLILPSESHGLRRMVERHLRDSGVAVEPAIEIDSYPCIKQLVADGHGQSVLPFHAVATEAAQGLLNVRPFAEPKLWRRAHLAWNAGRPPGRAVECVEMTLRDEIATLIARGVWAGARVIR